MDPVRAEISVDVSPQRGEDGGSSLPFEVKRNLRVVVLREIPDDPELRRQWNDLVFRESQPQVFYTYEWARAVQHAYSDSLHPLLFLGYEGSDLREVAALAESGDRTTFLCATTADYCDFLGAAEHKGAFVSPVLAELSKQGRTIVLTNLPADSDTVEAIRTASPSAGYRLFAEPAYECAQVSIDRVERQPGENGFALPGAKKVRRALSVLGREAPVRVVHVRTREAAQHELPEFVRAHVSRFLTTGRISNLARLERQIFLRELANLLCERGWLTLTQIKVGERAIAWNYGFQFAGTWFWYQPTFDSDFEKHSPGFCLLAKIVEEAANDPAMKTVDLGLGAEGYKEVLANQARQTLQLTLSQSRITTVRTMARSRLAHLAKRSSAVESGLRALIARQRGISQRRQRTGWGATAKWAGRRAWSAVRSLDEVYFYEIEPPVSAAGGLMLKAIDLRLLADAAMQNAEDEATLNYLLRSAQRLRTSECAGFALANAAGDLLHFAWASPLEKFYCAELASSVPDVSPGSTVLFDCWTPGAHRGKGYYAEAVARIAGELRSEGKPCWIFSASTNTASVQGLKGAGFKLKFSVTRHRFLWWQKVYRRELPSHPTAQV